MNNDSASGTLASLASKALQAASDAGFTRSSSAETGRLLQCLSATVRQGVICELGSGYGFGAGSLASTLQPGVRLVTVEADEAAAASVAALFEGVPSVDAVHGDWREAKRFAPVSLLFQDGGPASIGDSEHVARDQSDVLELLDRGGVMVKDDLTPRWAAGNGRWTADQVRDDAFRAFWYGCGETIVTEVAVKADQAVLIATRR